MWPHHGDSGAIYGGHSGTGTILSQSSLIFPYHYHSASGLYFLIHLSPLLHYLLTDSFIK